MSETLLDAARRAVKLAVAKGAGACAAGAWRARNVELQWRDGKVEKASEATTRALGLELYVDGRYAAVSTSDLRPDALARFIEDSVALARTITPDPFRRLPEPELYAGRADVDLELADPDYGSVTPEARRAWAQAIEAGTRSADPQGRILSATGGTGDTQSESAVVHSDGFEGTRRSTDFWLSADVTVQDPDGRRPEEYAAAVSRFHASLEQPEEIGRRAATRALSRIGTVKGDSAVMTVAVEARAAGRMASMLFGPLSASSLQQKRSFLDGKAGQAIGSPLLDVRDEPLVKRGFGSRLFDGEGIAAKPFALFEQGVLRNYYVDTYYGRKLGMKPTTGRMSNHAWVLGTRSLGELLADLKDGVLVTGFLGGNSNGTTGDFSLGVKGFRVRGGAIAEPVGEMNLSGNHLELWQRLAAIGNDPYAYSSMRTPTLVFEGVQIAGL
ncbi:MAG TPA: TldD/PmbA family protein [Anaeromyxobacteraceae bacterium]|nr:TldD/PmbA family protein [Anaeromyxobacteraceae bacterium]